MSEKIRVNKEVGFLYKKCKKIKPSVITALALVPEFVEVIKQFKGDINDEAVYRLLREKSKEMCNQGDDSLYRVARDVMKKVSRDVRGNTLLWEKEITDEQLKIHNIEFIHKELSIQDFELLYWVSVPEFVTEVQNLKQTEDTVSQMEIFEIMKNIYILRLSKKERGEYANFRFALARKSLKALSEMLYGDENAWEK